METINRDGVQSERDGMEKREAKDKQNQEV